MTIPVLQIPSGGLHLRRHIDVASVSRWRRRKRMQRCRRVARKEFNRSRDGAGSLHARHSHQKQRRGHPSFVAPRTSDPDNKRERMVNVRALDLHQAGREIRGQPSRSALD